MATGVTVSVDPNAGPALVKGVRRLVKLLTETKPPLVFPIYNVDATEDATEDSAEGDGGEASSNRKIKPRVQEKPDNAPAGTLPLDQAKKKFGLRGEDHNKIKGKKGTNSGPQDWVGIAPNGDVITTNPDGTAENWGSYKDFLN